MLATVVTFNVLALVFAFLAFRAPKVRLFDAEVVRRKADESSRDFTWDLGYEPDPEVTAIYMSWVGTHKCDEARRVAA